MSRFGRYWSEFDWVILITTVALVGFGSMTVYSATGGGPIALSNAGVKQAAFGLVGLLLMFVVASIDYRVLASFAWPLYGLGLLALALVLVPGIGSEIAGSRRWFDLQVLTVQPSEFAKLTALVALSAFIASRREEMRDPVTFFSSMLIMAAPAALVFEQPDLGTSLVFLVIWFAVALLSPARLVYFGILAALAPLFLLFAWHYLLDDYQHRRWLAFLDPESNRLGEAFNLIQARISIGSGGLTGFGILGGTQSQLGLLTVRESDFVFAHASGMFGFIGMTAMLACFVILLWRCIQVVEISRDLLGQCLAIGITSAICFQAFVNIGMNLGLMPVTGITLPFVSSGVSSLWSFLIGIGILQSIRMHHRKLGFQPD
ncbi:MAG: FtsW/RodA/SpoVE family cell cycle protein [Chloroflexota bacterium]